MLEVWQRKIILFNLQFLSSMAIMIIGPCFMENFLRSKEYWSLVENGITAAVEGSELTEA